MTPYPPPIKHAQGNRHGKTTFSVRVENMAMNINHQEVLSLFNTLIGDVRGSVDVKDAAGHHLDITFFNRDACKKALCMSGYTVSGTPLSVVPIADDGCTPKRLDDRRNLYVLGLPFDLTKSSVSVILEDLSKSSHRAELATIFSSYGTVAHCVILATVDNASRRRGFVVMSGHDQARNAMLSLTRSQIRGHTIDISWAIVQRSQGFLDGGDRAILFESHCHNSLMPLEDIQEDSQPSPLDITPNSSFGSNFSNSAAFTATTLPTNTLLVSELPAFLFSQPRDLHPLLDPFGQINKLDIIEPQSVSGAITVRVEYSSSTSAQEAKEALQGQCYANHRIGVQYLQVATSVLPRRSPAGQYDVESYSSAPTNEPPTHFAPASGPFRCPSNSFYKPERPYRRGRVTYSSMDSVPQISYPYHQAFRYASHPVHSHYCNARSNSRTSSVPSEWGNDMAGAPTRCRSPQPHHFETNTSSQYGSLYD
ncbi:uncharacterized protein BT62DRAFT_929573 [Guyanagaster necrorhizus]|uniref:RRM domain-containing protein n=1 Tax=Guyanagaster necrorhizus TaxID=856835 RepID=A0A9P8AUH2_9AGAR|nr:uncharacterized protein BT62DRAFT_929573 [Guyanagaster necrorhizus MCA 3950]KAG7448489.1 hypothetical protein BT62DRAFT_929573 [Guyanagaster necrorhizus MCA 3950]